MKRIPLLVGFCMAALLALAGSAPALGSKRVALGNPNEHVYMGAKQHTLFRGSGLRTAALSGSIPALRKLNAPAELCGGADDSGAAIAVQEQAMQCLVNFAREQAGLSTLGDLRRLDGSANSKAADILRCGAFSHEACGRDFLFWFRRAGYIGGRCWWAGENLAWGTGDLGSPRSIMRAWMHSAEHRANILGEEFDQFGISLRVGSLAGSSNAHVWVNHFGGHC